jgi:capsular exopolysaccharide synthesis family protein
MEIERYWAVIWKWFWLIIIGIVVAGGTSYFLSQKMEPVYQATATLVVYETTNPIPGYEYSQATVATHTALIKKQSVMEAVLNELDLSYSVKELGDKISIRANPSAPLIELSARDTDPLVAQQIANTAVQVYIEQHRQKLQADAKASLRLIQNEIEQTLRRTTDLLSKREDLEALKNLQTLWNLQLAQAMAAASIRLGESASLPTAPVSPRTTQNVILASILGLVVTTGGIFFKEYLERSVKTPEDVTKLTGLATLGIITRFKTTSQDKSGPIVNGHPQGTIAEAFRMLHTNLRFATVDKPAQTIMVTSAGPEEGKTSVLANLAVTMAQMGNRVIAVDTDLRQHQLAKFFGVRNDTGLTDLLLAKQPDVAGFLQPTKVEGLRVLTRGSHSDNPAQLLGSACTSPLVEALRKEADVVLFDSAPVLVVADATILAPKLDAAILVVEAGRTRPEALVDAKEALSRGNVNVLGVVLNRVEVSGRSGYYYYRYRYPSHYYDSKDGEKKRDKPKHSSDRQGFSRFLKRFTGK